MHHPNEQEWAQLDRHTCALNTSGGLVRLPPYGLILTLRTLVGSGDDIVASHALVRPDPETVWKIWAFTVNSIAFVEAKYETDDYEYFEDEQRRQGNAFGSPLEPTYITAWSRPVSTVKAFEIVQVRYISRKRGFGRETPDFYPTLIKMGFTDETTTEVNVGGSLDDELKRLRWEEFLTAARRAAT